MASSMIKRVLVVPLNYSHRQDGQCSAFDQIFGYQNVSSLFDYMQSSRRGISHERITQELVDWACDYKPDWIWCQLQETNIVQPWGFEAIKKALPKTLITHWMGDLRTEVSPYLAQICRVTDATLISNKGQDALYRGLGWKVHTAPELRVHDLNAQDDLRNSAVAVAGRERDGQLFWSRWRGWIPPDGTISQPQVAPKPFVDHPFLKDD